MATLIIRRQKAKWQDVARDYRVLVDDREVAHIANGAEVQVPIAAGEHAVRLKIDWAYSEELKINAATGDRIALECGPNASLLTALLYITVLRNKYLWLRHASSAQ